MRSTGGVVEEQGRDMSSLIKATAQRMLPYAVYSRIRDCSRYVVSFAYVGTTFECPFCNGQFARFLPDGVDAPVLREKKVVGGGYRLNSVCPRCRSEDRERLVYLFLKSKEQEWFAKDIKLLHIAPEKNLANKLKSNRRIQYVSADLDSPLADIQMDVTDIHERDETYDVIICNHVLEHIVDDARAMRELYRVLKRGGHAILQVPISHSMERTFEDFSVTDASDKERIFGQRDHVRIYGNDYVARLASVGFAVTALDFTGSMNAHDVAKYALLRDEKLFVCSKA